MPNVSKKVHFFSSDGRIFFLMLSECFKCPALQCVVIQAECQKSIESSLNVMTCQIVKSRTSTQVHSFLNHAKSVELATAGDREGFRHISE